MFKRLSLRMRITLFSGMVMLLASALLTGLSIYNAQEKFILPSDSSMTPSEPAITITTSDGNAMAMVTLIEAKRKFNVASLLYMGLVSAAGMALVYLVAGRALKPVRALSHAAGRITADSLGQRIPESTVKDEIGDLTCAFNGMLERLDEAFLRQKQFSSNAAHELKTPVTIIKASLQVLELEQQPTLEQYREAAEVTARTVERLSAVIDDLLVLADESADLSQEPVPLDALLTGVLQTISPLYTDKKIVTNVHFCTENVLVLCNETLAIRLFSNLLENAMKYNREQGRVDVTLSRQPDTVTVAIADTGSGIPPEQLPRVWDAFTCVDPSRSRKLGGAGLGLSIVKTIAGRFGWQLSMDSTPDVGTTVTVTIPQAEAL